MSANTAAIRARFPIFGARGPGFHYLDSAATGQIHEAAAEALLAYETRMRANVKRGIYKIAAEATEAFEQARATIARYLGAADADEIVLTSGCTFGLNVLAHGLCAGLSPGDEIVISELEHHSNIVPWQLQAERLGLVVKAIPVTEEGRLDLGGLDELIGARTRVISLAHVSNVTGAVTDVARVVEAARACGARVVLDGAQRAPHGPLDVQGLGIDAYVVSGHKMFGPTGSGAIWAKAELWESLPPFLGGGEMIRTVTLARSSFAKPPHRFEAGTPPIGAAIGLGAAAGALMALDWPAIAAEELRLAGRILDGLAAVPGVRVLGPAGLQQRQPVIAFAAEGVHAHDLCQLLDVHGVCLRGGHHCAQPLMERFDLAASARASVALYNDDADIDAFLSALEHSLRRLR